MNKVIILIGPSGSGKSTYAKKIKQNAMHDGYSCSIVSADNYFIHKDGSYRFDASKLSFAHDFCKVNFALHIASETNIIVVDNTNTTPAERYFYELLANSNSYIIEFRYMDEMNPQVCAARNIHGVPLATIEKQIERINSNR